MASEVGKIIYRIVADTKEYMNGIKETEKASGLSAAAIAAAFTAAAVKVGQAIGNIAKAGLEYNMEMERYQTSFETMLGSTEAALSKVEELRKMAASTPFELADLASATQTMLSFGIASEDASKYLNVLGDVSQGNREKLSSLTLAFSQMSSTGKLMGQDLLQMINAGFNPLQIISEKTGKSMSVLKDEMSKGAISAEMVADAFETATQEGGLFYGAMEKQSKTLSGQMSTLKDNTNEFLGSLTGGLSEIARGKVLPALNDAFGRLTKSVQTGPLKQSLDKLWEALGDVADELIDFAEDLIPKLVDALTWLLENADTLISTAKVLLSVLISYKAITGVANIVSSLSGAFSALAGTAGAATLSLSSVLPVLPLMVGAFVAISEGIKSSYAEVIAFERSVDSLEKTTESLKESTEDSAESFEKQKASIEAQTTSALGLLSKLEALQKVENKSTAQRKEVTSIVSQLNQLVPGLALAYDEEADALNKTTDAVLDYIVASKEKAMLAAYEERYTELAQERIQIEDALREAELQRAEAEAMLEEKLAAINTAEAERTQTITSLKGEYETYKQALADIDVVIAENQTLLQQNAEAQNAVDESVKRTTGSLGSYAGAVESAGAAGEQIIVGSYDITAALEGTGVTAEQAASKYQEYADITQNAFEKVRSTINLTAEELTANLEYNQEQLAEWTDNIAYLAEAGLDEGLIAILEEAGLEAAGTVANLVTLVEEGGSFEKLNAVFQNGSKVATDTLLRELGLPQVINSGSDTVTKIADGINNNTDAQEATDETIKEVKTIAVATIEECDFPSVGRMITSGIAAGIRAGRSAVINAAIEVAKAAIRAAKDALEINSPSRVAEDLIGKNFALGVAEGIKGKKDAPAAEAKSLAQGMVSSSIGSIAPDISPMLSPTYHMNTPTEQAFTINLVGNVQVDGFTLGQIMLQNLDDVSAFTLRG